jgi:hypothetical protein
VKMGPMRCPETSVNNYDTTPCNIPEERRYHQHRGGSLKLSMGISLFTNDTGIHLDSTEEADSYV